MGLSEAVGARGAAPSRDLSDAWLLNTCGYWYLDDTTHARIYGEGPDTHLGYLLSGQAEGVGLASDGCLPALRALYERLFSANEYQRIPVLSLLFAPALWVWLAALVGVGAASRGDRRHAGAGGAAGRMLSAAYAGRVRADSLCLSVRGVRTAAAGLRADSQEGGER